MGGNIPAENGLDKDFPGVDFPEGVWWARIFPGWIFLEPN